MAQNITLLGASYSDVPSILLPKTGGGQASFTDVTDTTATASDVASGKYFYAADGTRTLGTNSGGGGGGAIKVGALRPDAELVKTWSDDYMVVEDKGITIPSYSTSSTTLVASETLETISVSPSGYRYYFTSKHLTIPNYSIATKGNGRQDYCYFAAYSEYLFQPARQIVALDGSASYSSTYTLMNNYGTIVRNVAWSSATAIRVGSSSYGAYQNVGNPTASSSHFTVKSPSVSVRGNTSYMASTYMNALTDIRVQYIIQLWRVPVSETVPNGWTHGTLLESIDNDIANGGTLT